MKTTEQILERLDQDIKKFQEWRENPSVGYIDKDGNAGNYVGIDHPRVKEFEPSIISRMSELMILKSWIESE